MFGVTDGAVAVRSGDRQGPAACPLEAAGVVNGSVGLYLPSLSDAPSAGHAGRDGDDRVGRHVHASRRRSRLRSPQRRRRPTVRSTSIWSRTSTDGTYHLAIVRAYVGGAWVDELGNAPTQLALTPVSGVVNPAADPELRRRRDVGLPGVRLLCDLPVPDRVGARVDDGRRAAHARGHGARDVHVWPEGGLVHLEGVLTRRIHLVREGVGARRRTRRDRAARPPSPSRRRPTCGHARSRPSSSTRSTEPSSGARRPLPSWSRGGTRSGRRNGWGARGSVRIYGTSTTGATEDHAQYIATHPRGGCGSLATTSTYATFPNAASVTVGGTHVSLSARSGMSRWVTRRVGVRRRSSLSMFSAGRMHYPPKSSRIFAGRVMRRRWIVVGMCSGSSWERCGAGSSSSSRSCSGARTGGPLACPDVRSHGRPECPATVGAAGLDGAVSPLETTAHETVTLERVELLDVDPGLELVGMMVVEPDGREPARRFGLRVSRRREPGGTTHPVRGYVLPPAQ